MEKHEQSGKHETVAHHEAQGNLGSTIWDEMRTFGKGVGIAANVVEHHALRYAGAACVSALVDEMEDAGKGLALVGQKCGEVVRKELESRSPGCYPLPSCEIEQRHEAVRERIKDADNAPATDERNLKDRMLDFIKDIPESWVDSAKDKVERLQHGVKTRDYAELIALDLETNLDLLFFVGGK